MSGLAVQVRTKVFRFSKKTAQQLIGVRKLIAKYPKNVMLRRIRWNHEEESVYLVGYVGDHGHLLKIWFPDKNEIELPGMLTSTKGKTMNRRYSHHRQGRLMILVQTTKMSLMIFDSR